MASKYDDFRKKYSDIYQQNNEKYTGGQMASPSVSGTPAGSTSKYDKIRQTIATQGEDAILHSEVNKLKTVGKAIGKGLLDTYKQAQEEKASPNSVVRKPVELPTMGLTKIQQDQAAKAKAGEPDIVTRPHEAQKLVQSNTSPRLPYQNPEADKMKQTLTDVKAIVPGVNVNRDLLDQIGNTVNVDAFLKARREDNKDAPKVLAGVANTLDNFFYKNPVGKQIMGFSQGAGQTAGAVDESQPNVGSSTSRALGAVAGAVAAPIGNEGNLVGALPGLPRAAGAAAATATENPTESGSSWFSRIFGNQGVGITAGLKNNRTGTGTQIVNNPLKKSAETLLDDAKEAGRAIEQNYVDMTAPLKHLGGDVREVALDARRGNNLANTWVHDKAVTPEGQVLGNSLKDVIGSVPRGQGDAFEDYLIVRHAKTRVARGERVYDEKLGMNDVPKLEARQAELEAKYPAFKRLGDEWDAYNTRLLDAGESFGLISKAQKTAMREQNPNYASMRRQFSTSEKYSQPFARKDNSFSGQKAPIKAVSPTGSARKIVSPVRSAIEQTGAWMNAGMRNRVMQSILERVKADPEGMKGLVEIVPETSTATAQSLKEINDVLARDGMEGLTEFLNQDFSLAFRKASQAGSRTDNIVTVMVDGNPVKMRVMQPEVFKALVGLAPEETNFVMDFFGALSNATKRGATGALAPLFAAKGLTTDIAQALIQSKDPLRHIPDLIHATVSAIANQLPRDLPGTQKLRALAQDYARVGGEYSAALKGDKKLNKSVNDLRKDPFLSPRGIGKGLVNTVRTPFKALEGISDVSENINRIAAYKGSLRSAGGARTPETVRQAMRESQEITTNFSRKGARSNGIERFIPYSNAAIQGIRRFGKQWKERPIQTAAMTGLFIVGPKLWEEAKFGDDPDYQKLPERTKYRNLIIGKTKDGKFIQIPIPPEYGAIGAAAADFMGQIRGNPTDWRDVSDALVNAYTPPFISGAAQGITQGGGVDQSAWGLANSTSAGPLAGYLSNQSWTGAPIVPANKQDNSPYMQKDERTSKPAAWLADTKIGKAIGLSPMKLDYIAKQYGGDLARLGLPLTSDVGGGTPQATLLKNFIVDPTFTNNLSRDYYNKIDRVKQINNDIGDGAEAPKWFTEDLYKLATSSAKGSPVRRLRELNADKKAIQGDKTLSASAKAEKLRSVQQEINKIYIDVTSRLDAAGVK